MTIPERRRDEPKVRPASFFGRHLPPCYPFNYDPFNNSRTLLGRDPGPLMRTKPCQPRRK